MRELCAGVRYGLLVAAAVVVGLTVGCPRSGGNQYQPPPPPEVQVAAPVVRKIQPYLRTTGITEARRVVEVRPRVTGYITRIAFRDGQRVKGCGLLSADGSAVAEPDDPAKTGATLLFEIDRRPFEAVRDKAKADLTLKEAVKNLAEAELSKKEEAFRKNALAELEVIRARAEAARAVADVDSAKATLRTAELELSFTKIYAPIDGRAGKTEVQIGDLVGPGSGATAPRGLTTVVQDQPIYAYYNYSDRDVLPVLRKMGRQRPSAETDPNIRVDLGLDDEVGYPHRGVFDYSDPQVDRSTGTYRFRAVFPNENGLLVPGLYVKLRIKLFGVASAMLVPERAIGTDQIGRFVLVAGPDNVVAQKPVKLGELLDDGMRVIESGLSAEDRVIVNGIQRARPGGKVTPKLVELPRGEEPKDEEPDPVKAAK